MLEFIPFNQINEKERTAIWNEGFSDYLRPINMTEDALNHRLTSLNLSGEYSVVAVEEGIFKGVALYGYHEFGGVKQAWIGGLAVHPKYRKEGVGIAIMNHLEEISKELTIDTITMEVISENQRAINLYLKENYTIAREVSFLKGDILPTIKSINSLTLIKTTELSDEKDATIPWQNRILHGYDCYLIEQNGTEVGKLVCSQTGETLLINQISLPSELIENLLGYLANEFKVKTVVGVNLLSSCEEVLALNDLGIKVDLKQYQLEKAKPFV